MKTQTTITPNVSENFEVGAILVDTWGYEQTNVDFYCIIGRTNGFVTIQAMKTSMQYNSERMTSVNMPDGINENEKPMRKKIKMYDGKESGFSIRNYSGGGWCKLWDGKPQRASHYA